MVLNPNDSPVSTPPPAAAQAALLDLTSDAILIRDFDTDTILFWNRGAEELYGFTREEALGRVSHDLLRSIHPVPLYQIRETLLHAGHWEGELIHTRKGGRRVMVASRWAVQHENGRPISVLETNTDIFHRRRAEEAHQRLIVLAEASALLASSLDYETTLTSVARAVVPRLADWCAVHLVDDQGSVRQIAVTHPDPAKIELAREVERRFPYDPHGRGLPEVLRTGEPILVPEITDEMLVAGAFDPELLEIYRGLGLQSLMIVPLITRDHILGAITLVTAESGRRYSDDDVALAEILARRAALAVDNARLYSEAQRVAAERTTILTQMTDGIILCDLNGTVTFVNDAAIALYGRDFTGYSFADYPGTTSLRDRGGQPLAAASLPLRRALAGEVVVGEEARVHRPDGSEIIVQRNATPITAADGTCLGAVITVRDVTAQRTFEQQKDEFLSAAAHDLKTPLTSVKGLAQLLQRRITRGQSMEPEKLLAELKRIEQNATHMTTLINELLDVTRLQLGQQIELNRAPTDLVALTRRAVADLVASDGQRPSSPAHHYHRITVETTLPHLTGLWDADRLERVLSNLLSNAVKYSAPGTPITVTLTTRLAGDQPCAATSPEETSAAAEADAASPSPFPAVWAVLSIQDQGIGIPADDLPYIFERFRRGRNVGDATRGTGIGLAGVKQIIEQHGGTISAASREGQGSTFTVQLPLYPPDA